MITQTKKHEKIDSKQGFAIFRKLKELFNFLTNSKNKMTTKQQILTLKEDIRKMANEQSSLKNQRKTIHFKGVRTIPASEAEWLHRTNRYDLRHLYIAYGFMRNKTIEQIESTATTTYNVKKVEKIMEQYANLVCNNA